MITKETLGIQASSLAEDVGRGTPQEVSAIVIFHNRESGDIVLRAVRMDVALKDRILLSLMRGSGSQVIA